MKVLKIIKEEIAFFKKSNLMGKLFISNLFLWCMSIPIKNAIFQFTSILFGVLFIVFLFLDRRCLSHINRLFSVYKDVVIGFCVILITLCLSTILSEFAQLMDFSSIIKYFYRYMLLFFILIFFYKNNTFSKTILIVFILISLLFYALYGLYEFSFIQDGNGSIQSFLYNRNPFGLIMYAGIMVGTFCLYKIKEFKSRIIIYVIILVFTICMFLSYSRSAWVATTLFIFIIIIFNIKNINYKTVFINGFVLIIIGVSIYMNKGLSHRLDSLINLDSSNRIEIWVNAIHLIKEKILFGYGFIDYRDIGKNEFSGVHNSFFEVLLFSGIMGLLSYSYIILIVIIDILKTKKYLFLAILFSLFLISQFDYSIRKDKIFLSILTIAMFFILSHRVEKKFLKEKDD